jgi:hypothetical protein
MMGEQQKITRVCTIKMSLFTVKSSRSIMLYRILNNLVEVPLHQYIQIKTTRTRGSCAHSIWQISTRVDAFRLFMFFFFFFPV